MLLGNFVAEQDRWPLWLAVALGAGAGGYFLLSFEPSAFAGWTALVLALAAALLAFAARMRWVMALLAALLLGFGLAKLRENRVATPVLNRPLVAHLTGRIVSLEPRQRGGRLVLEEVHSGALQPAPRQVRVALRAPAYFHPGDWLSPARVIWGDRCISSPSARSGSPMAARTASLPRIRWG